MKHFTHPWILFTLAAWSGGCSLLVPGGDPTVEGGPDGGADATPSIDADANDGAVASSCKSLHDQGETSSGTYTLLVGGVERELYCDMDSDGGGWTLVLKTDESAAFLASDDSAISPGELASKTLNHHAKLADEDIRALQGGLTGETRVTTPDFTTRFYARGNGWSLPTPTGDFPHDIEVKSDVEAPYSAGVQCYDADGCAANHYCFGKSFGAPGEGERVCIRRGVDPTPGLYFSGGTYTTDTYSPGAVWMRAGE